MECLGEEEIDFYPRACLREKTKELLTFYCWGGLSIQNVSNVSMFFLVKRQSLLSRSEDGVEWGREEDRVAKR